MQELLFHSSKLGQKKSGIQIPTQRAVCPRHENTSQIKAIWPLCLKYKALNNEAEAQTDG